MLEPDMDYSELNLERIITDLRTLAEMLWASIDEGVEETIEEFKDELINTIKKSDIDRETGELLSSWEITPQGMGKYSLTSTVDHAVYLEVGTKPHRIPKSGEANMYFKPEPGTYELYPRSMRAGDGMIAMSVVEEHPGNEAYEYFSRTLRKKNWPYWLEENTKRHVNRTIANFNRGF